MSESRVALVTGANKGIGKEIARQLGAQGLTVILGARDERRGQEAADELVKAGLDAISIVIDVTNTHSIEQAAKLVDSRFGKLDILVNNAGIAIDQGAASTTDVELLRKTYETNVFGPVSVTTAFLPLLKKSSAGRIVNMSSSLGSLNLNGDESWDFASVKPLAYNSSKAALNMTTVIFAAELKEAGIKVNSACPGYVDTDLTDHRGPRTVEQGAAIAVRLATLPDDGPTGGYFNDDGAIPW
jgi:NAD(P)-dependent dehydrogenase (short-subunit alcohol dehydrogenase family)